MTDWKPYAAAICLAMVLVAPILGSSGCSSNQAEVTAPPESSIKPVTEYNSNGYVIYELHDDANNVTIYRCQDHISVVPDGPQQVELLRPNISITP
jgi:hypothetical protein